MEIQFEEIMKQENIPTPSFVSEILTQYSTRIIEVCRILTSRVTEFIKDSWKKVFQLPDIISKVKKV